MSEISSRTVRAPELYGDFWFNSEPLPIGALRGKIILVDFWDYSSINCLRTIPYIKEWNRRYQSLGLVVIGVHSPQYPFGRDPENVHRAIGRIGIDYPVVMDNQQLIWGLYHNRFLPAKYLIDKDGFIRHVFVGEGGYVQLEHSIQTLLIETGCYELLPLPMEPLRDTDKPDALCYRATPELDAGYIHGSLGNLEGYAPESTVRYADPRYYIEGRFYLDGNWRSTRTAVRLESEGGEQGSMIIPYTAAEVHVVVESEKSPSTIGITQDDLPLDESNIGSDVGFDAEHRSMMRIEEPRSYSVVRNRQFGQHRLRLESGSPQLVIHSISFISAVIPELIQNN